MIYSILYHCIVFIISMICGMCVNMFFITINTKYLYPLPSTITDLRDPKQLQQYVESLPVLAYFIVMIAHYGQSIIGSYIAVQLCRNNTSKRILVYIIVLLTMMGSIMNNVAILEVLPKWYWIEIPIYPIMAYMIDQNTTIKPVAVVADKTNQETEQGTKKKKDE